MKLRFASYNIRKAVGLDGRRNPGRILDVVNRLDADVIALQEADLRYGERSAALPREAITRETDFAVADVAENEVSLGWHGNAFLVRHDIDVMMTRRLPLPGLEPRGAILVKLRLGLYELNAVGTHLALLRQWRRQQLHAICDQIEQADTARTVLLGDFNEWSLSKGFEPLRGKFLVLAPGKTFHAARPLAALDRIAYGRDISVKNAGVDESPKARESSDHLPIWTDLALAPMQHAHS